MSQHNHKKRYPLSSGELDLHRLRTARAYRLEMERRPALRWIDTAVAIRLGRLADLRAARNALREERRSRR